MRHCSKHNACSTCCMACGYNTSSMHVVQPCVVALRKCLGRVLTSAFVVVWQYALCKVLVVAASAAILPCCGLCDQAPIDFNQYLGIQRAGIACLQLPQHRVREYAEVWRRRAAALVPVLRQHGWTLPEPKACEWCGCGSACLC